MSSGLREIKDQWRGENRELGVQVSYVMYRYGLCLQLRTVTLIKPYNLGDFDSIQILISESELEGQNTSIAIFWE